MSKIEAVQEGNKMKFFIPMYNPNQLKIPKLLKITAIDRPQLKFRITSRIKEFFYHVLQARHDLGYDIFKEVSPNVYTLNPNIIVDTTVKKYLIRCDAHAINYHDLILTSTSENRAHYLGLKLEVIAENESKSNKDKKYREYSVNLPFSSKQFGSLIKNVSICTVKCLHDSNFSGRKAGELLNITREGYFSKGAFTPTFTHKECFTIDKDILIDNGITLKE